MKQLKILAVDDDPFTLKMLDKKLVKEGYDIEQSKSGDRIDDRPHHEPPQSMT